MLYVAAAGGHRRRLKARAARHNKAAALAVLNAAVDKAAAKGDLAKVEALAAERAKLLKGGAVR